jgi:hypothetical protein
MWVDKRQEEGFKITHKGLLCWTPMPTPARMVPLRITMKVLEAVFTLVFWAMVSRMKDYYVPRICPWKIEDLPYDGCCSHTPLGEKVDGLQTSYSEEEINAMAAEHDKEVKQRNNETMRVKHARALENRDYECKVCSRAFPSKGNLKKQRLNGPQHRAKASGVVKTRDQLRQ